jgi:hypothetical protein
MKHSAFAVTLFLSLLPSWAWALSVPSLPAGMCPLDAKVAEHAVVIDYLTSANQGSNTVVSSFASCDELAAIAEKKGNGIRHYGAILQQAIGAALPYDRKMYVETVASVYGSGAGLTNAALSGVQAAVGAGATNSGTKKADSVDVNNKGIVFKNDKMVIIALKQTNHFAPKNLERLPDANKPVEVASTAAMTLIAKTPISVNLYAPAADADAFAKSSATLQPYVAALIAANP